MKGIHLVSTGSAVPKTRYDNQKISELVDTNDEWIVTRTGIKNRFICKEETCVSLAVEAARAAMEKAGNPVEKVSAVIVATSTADYAFPSTACLVAKELGLKKDVMSFDLTAACTGFLYGLEVARGILSTHEGQYVLLVGAEQLSRIVDYTDRSTCILFGDGAGAALLDTSEKEYASVHGSDGNPAVLSCNGVGKEEMFLHMKGNDVFRFAVTVLKDTIERLLEENHLALEDVDLVVCHQANARILDSVKRKFPGYEEKFFVNIEKYGNTSAASIPIALNELSESGRLKENMRILCVGFGAGLSWGGACFQI